MHGRKNTGICGARVKALQLRRKIFSGEVSDDQGQPRYGMSVLVAEPTMFSMI